MNELNALIAKTAEQYPEISKQHYGHNETTRMVTDEIPELLYESTELRREDYKIYGSVGNGNWVEIVWIGLLDRKITESTTKGYYVVFLFDKELNNLYLCLSLGWTQFQEEFGTREGKKRIAAYRDHFASLLNNDSTLDTHKIDLNATKPLGKGYEVGAIISKKYDIGKIEQYDINDDINVFLGIYDKLKSIVGNDVLNIQLNPASSQQEEKFNEQIAKATLVEREEEAISKLLKETRDKPPETKEKMIKQIARNRKFADYIKKKNSFTCEVCGREPFTQKNGRPYAEADHIRPLGGQSRGLDTPENLRCLCAQCHAIITYGSEDEVKKIMSDNKAL